MSATPEREQATRCWYTIEKDWPGHRVVLSRRRCKNLVKPPHNYCHVHRAHEANP